MSTYYNSPIAPTEVMYREDGTETPMHHDSHFTAKEYGLTKREYFAAKALQALLSTNPEIHSKYTPKHIAENAVGYADLLIRALNELEAPHD